MKIVRYYPRALEGDGGITGSVHYWSRTCVAQGVDVAVVYEKTPSCRQPPTDGVEWLPVRHRGQGKLDVPTGLSQHLASADVLVLHSGWTSHNIAAAMTARRLGVPYVLEPRGAYDPHIVRRHWAAKSLWWHTIERRLVADAAAIHVFFEEEAAHLKALGYHGPVVVAPNGVANPSSAAWDGGSEGFLLWLGRFDPEHKGLDLLLQAMSLLPRSQRPHLRMHGPDWRGQKAAVTNMAHSMGLAQHVVIGPPVHGYDKFELMARARGFVYPSRWEAFGNSVAEAAIVGLPILVTRYPLGRFLGEQSAARLCDASPMSIADGVMHLLSTDADALGERAERVARTALDWDRVVRTWLRQVEQVIGIGVAAS